MTLRPDRSGSHRASYDANKKRILALHSTCAICGKPVDKTIKYPDPMSPVIDHIIPVSKNGHPSDLNNLQLAHNTCNRQKSDNLYVNQQEPKVLGNRNLPQSMNWASYNSKGILPKEQNKPSTVIRIRRRK